VGILQGFQHETCHCVARAVLFVQCTRKNDATEVHRLALCEVWRAKDRTVVPGGWPEAVPLGFARLGAEIYSNKKEEALYFGGANNAAPMPGRSGAYHAINVGEDAEAPFRTQLIKVDSTRKRDACTSKSR